MFACLWLFYVLFKDDSSSYERGNRRTNAKRPKLRKKDAACNGTNLETWSKHNEHHLVKSEVDETRADEIVEPEEFYCCHLKSNHCEGQNGADKSL